MSENNGLASWQRAIQQLSEYNPDEYSATYNMGQEILRLEAKVQELESQREQAKKCIDEIHNLYQDDKVFTVYLSEGFYTDEFNELMLKLIYEHCAAMQEGK